MPKTKRAIAILGNGVDPATRDLIFGFSDADGNHFELRLAPEIVASMAVSLIGLGRIVNAPDDDGILGQVMVLAGAIPARGPDREPVLDFVFANGMHFPVTFPESSIQIFENALATLRHTSIHKEPPSQSRN